MRDKRDLINKAEQITERLEPAHQDSVPHVHVAVLLLLLSLSHVVVVACVFSVLPVLTH